MQSNIAPAGYYVTFSFGLDSNGNSRHVAVCYPSDGERPMAYLYGCEGYRAPAGYARLGMCDIMITGKQYAEFKAGRVY